MKIKIGIAAIAVLFILTTCSSKKQLVIYADPNMENFVQKSVAAFDSIHPGLDIEVKILESELIYQHMINGQPVDLAFVFNTDTRKKIEWYKLRVLAIEKVALVECKDFTIAKSLKSDTCWVKAASGSPLRRITDDWQEQNNIVADQLRREHLESSIQMVGNLKDACFVIGNSTQELKEYLKKGWVFGGFCYSSMAKNLTNSLFIIDESPKIPEAWTARIPNNRPHPEIADQFLDFISTKKAQFMLADEGFEMK